ncbi:hypothetical protein [Mycobacterium simiae]|uniref:hypothetical protein n=1 Tax=Mycobacterium simiae TaxID=1784 RepID=UPI0003FE5F55|nr:hypothetical protein [Mycobacterium simiae]PLV54161.1 membrane protein [Mycobacterium tuberculosis variant microti OV254]BBX40285.1 hypothetical protein MSIM_17360 [Mycobacterium simiae]
MSARIRALLELGLAGVALVGVGVCWLHARHTVAVAPVTDGQPSTTALVYNPQLLLLAMLLAMTAAVLAVLGTARLRRARAATPTS